MHQCLQNPVTLNMSLTNISSSAFSREEKLPYQLPLCYNVSNAMELNANMFGSIMLLRIRQSRHIVTLNSINFISKSHET